MNDHATTTLFPMTPPITEMSVNASLREHSELAAFVHAHNLPGPLEIALKLVEESFGSVDQVEISMMDDPESGEQWVDLAFPVTGETSQILASHDRYVGLWLNAVPRSVARLVTLAFYVK